MGSRSTTAYTQVDLGIFDLNGEYIMFLLNLSYHFISGDVDIRNKEIIQKSELKTKNMGRERNTSRELK